MKLLLLGIAVVNCALNNAALVESKNNLRKLDSFQMRATTKFGPVPANLANFGRMLVRNKSQLDSGNV